MIVRNFLGGGTGGEQATIFVTGLTQSDSVYAISPSGRRIDGVWGTYTVEGASVSCFSIPCKEYGTYTLTASNGKTQDVLIDVVADVVVDMSGKLWLYRDGDECEDVTGGWSAFPYRNWDGGMAYTPQLIKTDAMDMSLNINDSRARGIVSTNAPIPLNHYSSLNVHFQSVYTGSNAFFYFVVDIATRLQDAFNPYVLKEWLWQNKPTPTEEMLSIDVSNFSEDAYVIFNLIGKSYGIVDKVWLE